MLKYLFGFLFFVPGFAFANGDDEGMMHDMYNMMGFGGTSMMWFWWISAMFFIVVFVFIIMAVLNASKGTEKEKDSLSIAKERLAEGEITKQEFNDIKKELKKD